MKAEPQTPPIHSFSHSSPDDLVESFLVRFERARHSNQQFDVFSELATLPENLQGRALAELARIDLEYSFEAQHGPSPSVSPLLTQFPKLFADASLRAEVAKEHYRLCRIHGAAADTREIATLYDIDHADWPDLPSASSINWAPPPGDAIPFPEIGRTFCGFPIVAELGRGALARVYLARQPDLARRWVVLKVTSQLTAEAEQMACLQHSGIVPVYSVHRENDLYCICMPYLGAITLSTLMADKRIFGNSSQSNQALVSTIVAKRLSTIVSTTNNQQLSQQPESPLLNDRATSPGDSLEPNSSNLPESTIPGGTVPKATVPESDRLEPASPDLVEVGFETLRMQLGFDDLAVSLESEFLGRRALDAKIILMIQVVEAIAYAHRRGIVHRDLKPENILIGNDGRPVILDFNLAASEGPRTGIERGPQIVGGTIPYMSPQQLESLDTAPHCSPTDDVYSLGVILYQLLVGKLPFHYSQVELIDFAKLRERKRKPPTPCHALNADIPPSLCNIVSKCLAPDAENRYDSGEELLEDLCRFSHNRVLAHAPDRSVVERAKKFLRRHPLLMSNGMLASISVLLLTSLAVFAWSMQARARNLAIQQKIGKLSNDVESVLPLLQSSNSEPGLLRSGIAQAVDILQTWSINAERIALDSSLNELAESESDSVRKELGELALGLGESECKLANLEHGDLHLKRAIDWYRIVADVNPAQRQLAIAFMESVRDALDDNALHPRVERIHAEFLHEDQIFERLLVARSLGKTLEWRNLADEYVTQRPADTNAWFNLASARFSLTDYEGASRAFDVAARLGKGSLVAVFWRGVAKLKAGQTASSVADFTLCIEAHPEWNAARYNRALGSRILGELESSLKDMDTLIQQGDIGPREYSLRSQIHAQLGNQALARQDRASALQAVPQNADDWIMQGVLVMKTAPDSAIEHFRRAREIAPLNTAAIQNTSHVQSEILGDIPAAIASMSELIGIRASASACASRGILLARNSNFQEAITDAEQAAGRAPDGITMLQIAGIYALCSQKLGTAKQSLHWLARALIAQPNLAELAASDPDLSLVAAEPEFQILIGPNTR